MNRNSILRPLACAIILIFSAAPAFSGGPKKKATPIPVINTTISSVSADSISISQGNVSKTFTITRFTEITSGGQKVTAADLRPGMTVSVTMGTDPKVAGRIAASAPPVGAAAPAKPPKGKKAK